VFGSIALQLLVARLPFGPVLFGGRMPNNGTLAGALAMGCLLTVALETAKLLRRGIRHEHAPSLGSGSASGARGA
jgi:hypothetical protein